MSRKYLNYSLEELIEAVKTSESLAEALRKLNLKPVGGNYYTINKKICEHKLDTSHMVKQGWNKDKRLKDWSDYKKPKHIKKHLIQIREHKCEMCALSFWLDKPIPLELHHIDGNRFNNTHDNLQILCPNCHSFTDNWRKKKPL